MKMIAKLAQVIGKWLTPQSVKPMRAITKLDIILDLKLCDEHIQAKLDEKIYEKDKLTFKC